VGNHPSVIIAQTDICHTARLVRQIAGDERDRRRSIRRETRPEIRAARAALRAAHRTGDPGTIHRAEGEARRIRIRRPDSLPILAAKWALGGAVAVRLGWAMVTPWHGQIIATTAGLTGTAVAAWAWSCWVRARSWDGLVPTREERHIMSALTGWHVGADDRGLGGVTPGRPRLTTIGIECALRLDGRTTLAGLRKDLDLVKAHLRVPSAVLVSLDPHTRSGWAWLRAKTRRGEPALVATWSHQSTGIGLDTITRRVVPLQLDRRILIGGTSGSGKSWTMRPLIARALADGHRVVLVDPKGEEGALWRSSGAVVATSPEDISREIDLAVREMDDRGAQLAAAQSSQWRGRLLILVVDEGRAMLAGASPEDLEAMTRVATMGRARGVVIWWATQHPTTSGRGAGLTSQLAAVMDTRICLRVRSRRHARIVLDDDVATCPAHEIPADRPGLAYIAGTGHDGPVQVWAMPDDTVIGHRTQSATPTMTTEQVHEKPSADVTRPIDPPLWMLRDGGTAREDILAALAHAGPMRQVEIVSMTHRGRGTVSRIVRALTDEGLTTTIQGRVTLRS
jgi:hypothetical protein